MSESTHRLSRARVNAGLSLEQAAERLGVERGQVMRWETSRDVPDDLVFARCARLYRVNIPWLRGTTPLMAPEPLKVTCMLNRSKKPVSEHDRNLIREVIASLRSPDKGSK